jgi:hypothetical protein
VRCFQEDNGTEFLNNATTTYLLGWPWHSSPHFVPLHIRPKRQS